jgi:hypothetical protein
VIGKTEFSLGLGRIAVAVRQALDAETVDVYHVVLGGQTDLAEWAQFTEWALRGGRFEWFPKLRELQDALREFRGDRPLLVEATEAYERVLGAGNYTPEGGTTWGYRSIKERCGQAAADAFLAAGGNSAFGSSWEESKRRTRFVEAYSQAVHEVPASKLLPAAPSSALPPAEVLPTREEAASVVEKLRDLAGVEPPKPKTTVVEVDPARVEALKRELSEASGEPT